MRKFFFGFGVVMALIICIGAIGLFVLARNGRALDAESKAYVQDSVVTIAGQWNVGELWNRATPHLRQSVKQEDLRALFDAANTALGRLLEYRGSNGQAIINFSNAGNSVIANYDAKARFEKGDADFIVGLVKDGSEWRIEGFHISSTALMKGLVGVRS